jgi:hypothetical protein
VGSPGSLASTLISSSLNTSYVKSLKRTLTPVWIRQVREQGGFIEVLVDVNAKAEFEKKYWKGILDAQGKADGGYY